MELHAVDNFWLSEGEFCTKWSRYFSLCLMLGQGKFHEEVGYIYFKILKVYPVGMASKMVLCPHFKNSVKWPTFTSFGVHFFSFTIYFYYIYSIPYWCSVRSQKWLLFFCLIRLWFIAKDQIFINHLSSGYEIIFQVVQLSPSS